MVQLDKDLSLRLLALHFHTKPRRLLFRFSQAFDWLSFPCGTQSLIVGYKGSQRSGGLIIEIHRQNFSIEWLRVDRLGLGMHFGWGLDSRGFLLAFIRYGDGGAGCADLLNFSTWPWAAFLAGQGPLRDLRQGWCVRLFMLLGRDFRLWKAAQEGRF